MVIVVVLHQYCSSHLLHLHFTCLWMRLLLWLDFSYNDQFERIESLCQVLLQLWKINFQRPTMAYEEQTISRMQNFYWFKKKKPNFIEDAECYGCPTTAITNEMLLELIYQNMWLIIDHMVDQLVISYGTCQSIFKELNIRLITVKYMWYVLTCNHKQQCINVSWSSRTE